METYIKREVASGFSWSHMLEPFSSEFWWVVSTVTLMLIAILSMTWYVGFLYGTHQRRENFNIYNSWFYIFGSLCQRG
jgi:hypothetical protein